MFVYINLAKLQVSSTRVVIPVTLSPLHLAQNMPCSIEHVAMDRTSYVCLNRARYVIQYSQLVSQPFPSPHIKSRTTILIFRRRYRLSRPCSYRLVFPTMIGTPPVHEDVTPSTASPWARLRKLRPYQPLLAIW